MLLPQSACIKAFHAAWVRAHMTPTRSSSTNRPSPSSPTSSPIKIVRCFSPSLSSAPPPRSPPPPIVPHFATKFAVTPHRPSSHHAVNPTSVVLTKKDRRTNPPLGPGSEGTAAARPPGGLHAGMPSSHKVMERPPSAPEVQAGGRPEAHRTATSPRCPTKKGRAAGPRACPEGPAARRVASQAGW